MHDTGNIAVAFVMNTLFAVVELAGGLITNSVAILSDALHDFGDSLSLGTAWYFQRKSRKASSESYNYGYLRFSLVGAFINAVVLLVGSIFIIHEAVSRLTKPVQPDPGGMIILAVLGIVVNGAAMLRLRKGSSVNEKMVSIHFLEDVLGWLAVMIGAVVMMFKDIPVLDPILSLAIAAFVLFNVYRNIKPAFQIILQGAPDGLGETEIRQLVVDGTEVLDLHDFHLWTLDGEHHILSMHIVVNRNMDLKNAEVLKENIKRKLHELHITHATIEVEYDPDH
ncbi:cation diffusion facilitator family transporter [Flavihumibacter solisilvae]|uniref:cation diffusion facilitator family transporter n=1 Tax=Flavihumibacter solisilvae TaxID=1349421 RepID=UPI000A4DFE6D|nr:cation diffusion facilitator family transporter [Flavihumibacter solisilvae]